MIRSAFNVKLTDQEVYVILYLNRIRGLPTYQLATMFPVTENTIKKIVKGKTRKDCYAMFMKYKDSYPEEFRKLAYTSQT